ncbi:HAMP domain-containing histidine kinase [Mesobacillus maritimus]|uniref:sensor histidine kinase n=1 Tax=Mesobacillus maritimus TaxID=1643336 RepID=UPI00203CA3B9|nr:ATP-binding protein [Mesobacillus maritimus]MCM3669053.1 HAMP domain-containing histidine kinase [Mesobacillus maritimus]
MKIKQWLLLSYFIVMVLPLAVAYLLFAWIQTYNNEQKVDEYFTATIQLQNIIAVLDDPSLYKPGVERPQIDKLVSSELFIALYNPEGLVLYSSDPTRASLQFALTKEELYKDLYSLEQGYRSFTYKQPVLNGNDLIGFYEVQLARDEWVAGVSDRTWIMFGIFSGIFFVIFLTIAFLVNKKINKRLRQLMEHMTAFAKQEKVKRFPTGKDEIGELTAHFYEMQEQVEGTRNLLAKEQREKEYMIATISHDLKTPLTSISAYAESLFSEPELTAEERKEYRYVIVDKANYMKQMIDDLLMYTLLQSPSYEMELIKVDGSEFFEMLVSDYEPLCKKKNISLHVQASVGGDYLVNPKQLMRVCDNLMSNAIQHTKENGNIWLSVISQSSLRMRPEWLFPFVQKDINWNKEPSVYLIVQNDGASIPADKVQHVFNPLFQVDQARSKTDARGTGLGLSISKQIIEKHRGEVQLYSQEEIGTCVICRIPKVEKEGERLDREKNY